MRQIYLGRAFTPFSQPAKQEEARQWERGGLFSTVGAAQQARNGTAGGRASINPEAKAPDPTLTHNERQAWHAELSVEEKAQRGPPFARRYSITEMRSRSAKLRKLLPACMQLLRP